MLRKKTRHFGSQEQTFLMSWSLRKSTYTKTKPTLWALCSRVVRTFVFKSGKDICVQEW